MMPDDRRSLTARLTFVQYLVAAAFSALAIAFWVFQVAQHEKFKEMAENNHIRRLPLPAPRGVLFDRNGKILVENQSTYNIALLREQTKDVDRTLQTLASAIGVDVTELRETYNRKRREPSYRPIVLVENATRPQIIALRARKLELPSVPTRRYRRGSTRRARWPRTCLATSVRSRPRN
jgi:penicillin-binding protein 2